MVPYYSYLSNHTTAAITVPELFTQQQLTSQQLVSSLVVLKQARHHNWCPKRASSIQYGYRKWGSRARVFSQSLAHGNNKIEVRQWNRGGEWMWKEVQRTRKKRSLVGSLCLVQSRQSLTTVRLTVQEMFIRQQLPSQHRRYSHSSCHHNTGDIHTTAAITAQHTRSTLKWI